MGVSKNNGTPKSSILIGFSIINHPFWGTPIFGIIHIFNPPSHFYRGCCSFFGDHEMTGFGWPVMKYQTLTSYMNWKGDYLYICLNQAPWEVNFFPSTFWVSSAQFSMTDG